MTWTGARSDGDHRRVGILWRGERGARRPASDRGLDPLFEAFATLHAEVVPLPFAEEHAADVRAQLSGLDALLVWVNPIQDGADRRRVDELLDEAAARGVWVSAHPDAVRTMGTKQVLFETRHLGWGSDTSLYRSVDELADRLPARLAGFDRLVLKQGRGNGGQGVWSVELEDPRAPVSLDAPVLVQEAHGATGVERVRLGEFVERCAAKFSWSGVFVDQEYQRRLEEGMVRCYFSHGEVVGFRRQWPSGLIRSASPSHGRPSTMEGPEAASWRVLRERAETEWVPDMVRVLGLDERRLPVIWDADFLFGTADDPGEQRYVLCEINVSAVWPYPPSATPIIASNTLARLDDPPGD